MRTWDIAGASNRLTQRVHAKLADRGHQVPAELSLADEVLPEGSAAAIRGAWPSAGGAGMYLRRRLVLYPSMSTNGDAAQRARRPGTPGGAARPGRLRPTPGPPPAGQHPGLGRPPEDRAGHG
jgi:hypothetical protein